MAYYADEADDLLDALESKNEECDMLRGRIEELLGKWLFAEMHGLKITDMVWLERNKISVLDTPDGGWELVKCEKRMITGKTVRACIDLMRAFETDA